MAKITQSGLEILSEYEIIDVLDPDTEERLDNAMNFIGNRLKFDFSKLKKNMIGLFHNDNIKTGNHIQERELKDYAKLEYGSGRIEYRLNFTDMTWVLNKL